MRRLSLLLAVVVLVAGCGGGETVAPAPETVVGTVPAGTETAPAGETGEEMPAEGDPDAGMAVFTQAGCGSCHVLEAAGTQGQAGPNLDESLEGTDAAFIRESIVDPNAEIAEGFQPGVMPQNYEEQLSEEDLADLVAFLEQQA